MAFENERNDLVAVGTSPVLVSVADRRLDVVLTNNSPGAEKIKIVLGRQPASYATAGGVPLLVNSVFFASKAEGYEPTNSEIWAISDSATGVLAVYIRPNKDKKA